MCYKINVLESILNCHSGKLLISEIKTLKKSRILIGDESVTCQCLKKDNLQN